MKNNYLIEKGLRIVGHTSEALAVSEVPDVGEPTLRDRVNLIVDERRKSAVASLEKTIIYMSEMGATEVALDEVPGIHLADVDFICGWLIEQGLKVKRSRFGGRTMIAL